MFNFKELISKSRNIEIPIDVNEFGRGLAEHINEKAGVTFSYKKHFHLKFDSETDQIYFSPVDEEISEDDFEKVSEAICNLQEEYVFMEVVLQQIFAKGDPSKIISMYIYIDNKEEYVEDNESDDQDEETEAIISMSIDILKEFMEYN